MRRAIRIIGAIWVPLAVPSFNTIQASEAQEPSQDLNHKLKTRKDFAMNEQTVPTSVDSIDPVALRVFRDEMKRQAIDLSKYDLFFYETETSYIVVTSYKLKPSGLRGSLAGFPDYEAEILRKDNTMKSITIAR